MSTNIVVSYGDIILRESDVELLHGPFWLNDNVISFYFEYLSNDTFKSNPEILFVSPEVTHCLKSASSVDELSIFLDPLETTQKNCVFFVLNDNRAFGESGGTHWSLLVFWKRVSTFFHVDSMKGSNRNQAEKLCKKLLCYLGLNESGVVKELPCLQQDNGYDCGIFVMAHAKFLADAMVKSRTIDKCGQVERSVVKNMRKDVLALIERLQ